jgi:hypothetical protein
MQLPLMEAPIQPPPNLTQAPPQPIEPSALSVILNAFAALGYALSARALLLLSLIGAFVLACMAMTRGDNYGLAVLIAFCVLTVIPVTALEIRRRME